MAQQRTRAAWGSLSREQVVDAAEAIVRRGDFSRMTIRSLAAEIGVAPMSLYRHVRDKDDLLEEVVDRLMARRWRPRVGTDDWRAWTQEAAERFRDFLVREPVALHIYLRKPVTSPASVQRMTEMILVLRAAGFDEQAALRAYAAIHTYTIGFAALEASRTRSEKAQPPGNALAAELASFTTAQQFSVGLAYLLEGIESRSPNASD